MNTPPNDKADGAGTAPPTALAAESLALFECSPGANLALDPDSHRILAASNDYLRLTQRSREQLVGQNFFDAFPDDPANPEDCGSTNLLASFARVRATLQQDVMALQRHPILNPDTGLLEERFWKPVNTPVLDGAGRLRWMIHSTEDVTVQHRSDESLRRAQTLERIAGMTARVGGWVVDLAAQRRVTWAPEIFEMYEWEGAEPPHISLVNAQLHPESRELLARVSAECERSATPFDVEVAVTSFKGTPKWFRIVCEPELNTQGRVIRMIGAVQDITHLKRERQRIRESEERLQYVTEAALDIVWDIDLVAGTCWVNHGVAKFGYDFGNQAIDMEAWLAKLHPDDRQANTPGLESTLADPAAHVWACSYRFLTANGKWVHFEDRSYILRDDYGRPIRMIGGSTDVSKRLEMEEQLLQTQRLESLGQLTGGIAHDFNNLLTVILGNAELLQEELGAQERLLRLTSNIDMAATRGAKLTRQLLAFSRKQALQPASIDINRLLVNLRGMLARTLGEHIVIDLKQQADLWLAFVDPNQLEVALLNLCINSRDAMPNGGTVTMETGNVILDETFSDTSMEVKPGHYVRISISDTGVGIPADVLDHVFEPFFTTKEKGKGTGLGLSMVFGFVKQSNGHINIYSEVGLGTTIRLYLPQSAQAPTTSLRAGAEPVVPGGNELVLLVEDNELVRQFGEDLLRTLDYRVLSAGDGESALALLQQHPDIRLLFTDVVMPGMGGHELAQRALQLRPALKVLYTSGYTQDSVVHNGKLDTGVHLLAKPYSKAELAAKLREVLSS